MPGAAATYAVGAAVLAVIVLILYPYFQSLAYDVAATASTVSLKKLVSTILAYMDDCLEYTVFNGRPCRALVILPSKVTVETGNGELVLVSDQGRVVINTTRLAEEYAVLASRLSRAALNTIEVEIGAEPPMFRDNTVLIEVGVERIDNGPDLPSTLHFEISLKRP